MDIKQLHKEFENCPCGKQHKCPIDNVLIGHKNLNCLSLLCNDHKSILLVSDQNTYKACGGEVFEILKDKISKNLVLEKNGDVVIPNEEKIAQITNALPEDCDLVIGVGSGVINDLCKYVSFKNDLPYFIVATAPSMDGYASVGAALILEGMKVTINARPPKAIIADTCVLASSPMDMIRAGYGDIVGKYSCLNDWRLSALVNGEYFCDKVYDLTYSCAEKVKNMAHGVNLRDEETVGALMEALVTVGVAMSFVDCSRPASGSEHHLSHFFEITGILEKKEYFSHGIDVLFSAVETAKVREKLCRLAPSKKEFDRNKWENEIRRVYHSSAEGVISLQNKLGWYEKDDFANVSEKWEEIKKILADSPTADEFIEMAKAVCLDYADLEKMYGREKISDAVLYAKDLKDRYTVLWLNFCFFE